MQKIKKFYREVNYVHLALIIKDDGSVVGLKKNDIQARTSFPPFLLVCIRVCVEFTFCISEFGSSELA